MDMFEKKAPGTAGKTVPEAATAEPTLSPASGKGARILAAASLLAASEIMADGAKPAATKLPLQPTTEVGRVPFIASGDKGVDYSISFSNKPTEAVLNINYTAIDKKLFYTLGGINNTNWTQLQIPVNGKLLDTFPKNSQLPSVTVALPEESTKQPVFFYIGDFKPGTAPITLNATRSEDSQSIVFSVFGPAADSTAYDLMVASGTSLVDVPGEKMEWRYTGITFQPQDTKVLVYQIPPESQGGYYSLVPRAAE